MNPTNLPATSSDAIYVPSSPRKRGRDDDEDDTCSTPQVKRLCPPTARINSESTVPVDVTSDEKNEVLLQVRSILALSAKNHEVTQAALQDQASSNGSTPMDRQQSNPSIASTSTPTKTRCHGCQIASKEATTYIINEAKLRAEIVQQKKEMKRVTHGAIDEQNLFQKADKAYKEWMAHGQNLEVKIKEKDAEIDNLKKQLNCGGDKSKWQNLYEQEKQKMDTKVGEANTVLQEVHDLRRKVDYHEKGGIHRDLHAAHQHIKWLMQGGLTNAFNTLQADHKALKASYDTLLATAQAYEKNTEEAKLAAPAGSGYTQGDMDAKNQEITSLTASKGKEIADLTESKDKEIQRLKRELATKVANIEANDAAITKAAGTLKTEQDKTAKLTADLALKTTELGATSSLLGEANDKNHQLVKASVVEKLENLVGMKKQKQHSIKLLSQNFARLWLTKSTTSFTIKKLNDEISVHQQKFQNLASDNQTSTTKISEVSTQNTILLEANRKLEVQVLRDDKLEEIKHLKKDVQLAKDETSVLQSKFKDVETLNKRFFAYLSCPEGNTAPLKGWRGRFKDYARSKPTGAFRSKPIIVPGEIIDPEAMAANETRDGWVKRLNKIAARREQAAIDADIQSILETGPDHEEDLRARLRASAQPRSLVKNSVPAVSREEQWAEFNKMQDFANAKSQQAAESGDLRSLAAEKKMKAPKKERKQEKHLYKGWQSWKNFEPAASTFKKKAETVILPGAFETEEEEVNFAMEDANIPETSSEEDNGSKSGLWSKYLALFGAIINL